VTPRRRLSDRTADDLVRGRKVPEQPALSAFVAEASGLIPETAPAPSYRLGALLEQGPPVTPTSVLRRPEVRHRAHPWRRVSLVSTAFLALLLFAASVNTLPAPAQQLVSDVVDWVSPLHVPAPDHPRPARRHVTPAASTSPTGSPHPAAAPSAGPSSGPTPATPAPAAVLPSDEPTEEPTEEPTDVWTDEPSDTPTDDSTTDPEAPSGPLGLGSHLPLRP
jgi:hypothetical protein